MCHLGLYCKTAYKLLIIVFAIHFSVNLVVASIIFLQKVSICLTKNHLNLKIN